MFSVFTAAAGLTHDPITFSITRFIAGLGIGGVLPIVTAQMAEFAPVKIRARLVTLVFAGYSVGGILVALTGKQLIETYGWQSVFFAALLPVAADSVHPEDDAGIDAVPDQEEPRRRTAPARQEARAELSAAGARAVRGAGRGQGRRRAGRQLFHDGRGFSTVMIWIAFFLGLFMVYALSSWLTKLMAMAGYSLGSALNFVLVFNVGAMIGAVLGGWLGDKFNIKYVLVAFYAVGALSLTLMGYTKSTELLFVVVFVVGASTLGTQLLAYAYAGEFYPTAIRSTGVGFASGIGRMGAILAPILIGVLVALNLPLEQNFMAIGLAGLLGMIAVMLIDQRLSASTHHYDATKEAGGPPIVPVAAAG